MQGPSPSLSVALNIMMVKEPAPGPGVVVVDGAGTDKVADIVSVAHLDYFPLSCLTISPVVSYLH